ncbi:MAG: phosphoglycerate kinase [Candidatus Kaiserbacteria bacterium]|nr:phosphoglycerate kinase [Candidatus Kaiserbacteria bacterium]
MLVPALHNEDIPYGHHVLLRASLNVPINATGVAGQFRLRETIRTIEFLKEKGARITMIGHLGGGETLAPVHQALNKLLPISFLPKLTGEEVFAARGSLQPGEVLLLENTRTDSREEENDPLFVEELAAQTDLFVFDDFSAAHRSHASTVGLIQELPSCGGIRFYEELTGLLRITERLISPALAVIGGAKCATKLPIIERLAETYDTVFVGGVTANTIFKQQGYEVGDSVTESVVVPDSLLSNRHITLPHDVLVQRQQSTTQSIPIGDVQPNDRIVDIGDQTLATLGRQVERVKTVVFNGPLGWYEHGFSQQTLSFSDMVAQSDTYSFVGGGDVVTILEQHNHMDDWKFVSTGGGSLLDYLSTGTLPVLDAFAAKRHSAAVHAPSLS